MDKLLALPLLLALASPSLGAKPELTDPATQPNELGDVHWYRNVDEGVEAAKESRRPIFLQFQEVPG